MKKPKLFGPEQTDLCEAAIFQVSIYSSLKWGFWLDDLQGLSQSER